MILTLFYLVKPKKALTAQDIDYIAQRQQALVDINSLLEAITTGECLRTSLRAGKIDQIKF